MNSKIVALWSLAPAFALVSACNPAGDAADQSLDAVGQELLAGVNITNARLVLSPVSGNPAAVYFNLTYVGEAAVSLESATVEGAQTTMIHQIAEDGGHMMAAGSIALTSGDVFELKPGGFHVMAMGPSPELEASAVAPVTITLSDGTIHNFEAEIRAAGEER